METSDEDIHYLNPPSAGHIPLMFACFWPKRKLSVISFFLAIIIPNFNSHFISEKKVIRNQLQLQTYFRYYNYNIKMDPISLTLTQTMYIILLL